MWRSVSGVLLFNSGGIKDALVNQVRYRRPLKYKKRDTWKIMSQDEDKFPTLKDKVAAACAKDPILDEVIDISLPVQTPRTVSERTREREWRASVRGNQELEKSSRHRTLKVPLDQVQEDWLGERGAKHIQDVCDHYGIFEDLYGAAWFLPRINMSIEYDEDTTGKTVFVHRGNLVHSSKASSPPRVQYPSDPGDYWTLVFSSPDGNLYDNDKELLHWMIANIPGSSIDSGEVLCEYIQPFPPKGTGHGRYVFILYKQEKLIDFKRDKVSNLRDRTFSTYAFYREHQDHVTPVAVNFFQAEWDESVTNVYQNLLGIKEPTFEYDFPPDWHPKQKKVPHRQPFNLYLDRYMDKKVIEEHVRRERLLNPQSDEEKYPNIYKLPNTPTWLRQQIQKKRLKLFQWRQT